jgi:hypothetical protein
MAAFRRSAPAAAQGWEEYSYPDYPFSVAFPANPQVETTTYQVADNRVVLARVYSLRQNGLIFKMTVAELDGRRRRRSPADRPASSTLECLSFRGGYAPDMSGTASRPSFTGSAC